MHLRLTCTPEHHCTSASEASLNYGAELWNGFDCSRQNWKGHLTQQCTSHSLKITPNHRSTFRWKIDRKMLFFPPSFIFNPITHFSISVYRQQLTQCNSYTNALRFSISHVGNTNCTPGASCCGNGGSRADTHSHGDEGIFLHAQNVLMCRVLSALPDHMIRRKEHRSKVQQATWGWLFLNDSVKAIRPGSHSWQFPQFFCAGFPNDVWMSFLFSYSCLVTEPPIHPRSNYTNREMETLLWDCWVKSNLGDLARFVTHNIYILMATERFTTLNDSARVLLVVV